MLLTLLLLAELFARNNVVCSITIWSGKREAERDFITGFPVNLNCGNIAGKPFFQNKFACEYPKMFHIKDRTYGCYGVNSVCQDTEKCLLMYATNGDRINFLKFNHSTERKSSSGKLNCDKQDTLTCQISLKANFSKWTSSGWHILASETNVRLSVNKYDTYSEFQINPNVLSESNLLKISVWPTNDSKSNTNYVFRIGGNFTYPVLAYTTTPTTTTTVLTTKTTEAERSIKTSMPTIATSTTSYINGKKDENTTKGKNHKTTIMYIVISIVALVTFILCFVFIRKRKAQKTRRKDREEEGKQSEKFYGMADKPIQREKTNDASETYASITNLNKLQIKTNDKTHEKSPQREVYNCLKDAMVTVYEPLSHEPIINDEYAVIDRSRRIEKVYLQETNVYYEAGFKIRSCDSAEQQQLHQNPEEEPIYLETVGGEYGVVEKPRKGNEKNSKESTEIYAQVQKHPMV